MKEAVLYARVSSDEQRERGCSLPAQIKLLKLYAKKENLTIVKEFQCQESAKKPGRKVFNEMVGFVRKNDIPHILVYHTDRLYRSMRDYVTILELAVKVHLIAENRIVDQEDFEGVFWHELQVAGAKKFIGDLRRNSMRGMREKAAQGHFPGRSPMGYSNNKEKRIIESDPQRAHFIKQIFELYSTGEYSLKRMAEEMNRRGLRGRTGAKITKRAIETILSNHFYYGIFSFKGKMYQGKHEPIIAKSLFDRAQEQLKNRGKSIIKGRHNFHFKGIAKCGYCGCAITAEIKKGRYIYYRCTQGRGKCELKYFREEEIAQIFREPVGILHLDDEIIEWVKEALVESANEQNDFLKNNLQRLRAEYSKNEIRKSQIYEDKLSEIISEDFFKEKFNQIEQRQAVILEEIEHFECQEHHSAEEGEKILELLNCLENQYDRADIENKAKMLKVILSNSVLTNEKCLFSYRKPFDALAEFGKMEFGSATGIRTPV